MAQRRQFTELGPTRACRRLESMPDYMGEFEDHRTEPVEFIDEGDSRRRTSERGSARSSSVVSA